MKPTSLKELIHVLFVAKSDHGFIQLFRYLFVGGFSALVDIGSLLFFTEVTHVFYLLSAALAFVLGTIVNYLLSIAWIFESSGKLKAEFTLFTLVGLGGLGLNELIIWIMVEHVGLHYLVAKFISVSVVVFWSFTLRRLLFTRIVKQAQA